jgi:hypothetical protein
MADPVASTPLIVGLLVWLMIAAAIGGVVYRARQSRIAGILTTALLFVVPIWDLPAGLAMYSRFVNELGGNRVFKTVVADGYLNLTNFGDYDSAVGTLANAKLSATAFEQFPYSYVELHVATTHQFDFIQQTGYWEIRLSGRGQPECKPFEDWASTSSYRERHPHLDEWCVVAQRRDEPLSRFQWEVSRGREKLPGPRWLPPVWATWERITDRETSETLAQSYALRYESWFPMPRIDEARPLSWNTEGSGPGFLKIANIIRPTKAGGAALSGISGDACRSRPTVAGLHRAGV